MKEIKLIEVSQEAHHYTLCISPGHAGRIMEVQTEDMEIMNVWMMDIVGLRMREVISK